MRHVASGIGLLMAVLLAAPLHAQAPTGTVRGRVSDATSQKPLSSVSVTISGRTGVSSASGRYEIVDVPAGTATLTVRLLGYAPKSAQVTVKAGETVEVNVELTAQAVNLTEVVATGYGEQRAADITGAVTAVSSDEFIKGRVVTPTELIQSKVAGVQVVDNNEPGGGLSIRIRGATSVNASSEPLIVVDGLPLGSGAGGGVTTGRDALNFLNPNDIESIVVLRDASSAAIYGANAANGVVLITTKTGRRAPSFEYTGTFSVGQVTRTPSLLNATQFRDLVTQFAPQNVAQLGTASTDWYKQIDRTALGQEHNVAFSGSGEHNDYRFSANYLNQQGIVQASKAERLALGISYNQRLLKDRLSLKFNVRGSRQGDFFTPGGVISNAANFGPTQPVLDPNSLTGYYNWPGNKLTSADNPAEILALARDQGRTYRSVGNVLAQYTVPWIEGLTANVSLGYDLTRAERNQFNPSVLHGETKTGNRGSITRQSPNASNNVLDAFLDYALPRPVGPGNLQLTGGYSYSKNYAEFPVFFESDLATDALGLSGIPAATTVQNRLDIQESKLISFFGRANYNIQDRFLLAGSIRRDGSSRFGPQNSWGVFPSVSGAWRLSQEGFLRNSSLISDLKLRASWARTGNQAFANYQQFTTFTPGDAQTQYPIGGVFVPTLRPSAVDPNIKWEATRTVNFGLDFGLWRQRVSGAIDVYDKKTTDLIFTVPVAAGTNLSNFVTTNIGSMRNRGVELSLHALIKDGGRNGLSWNADFTAARNKNELLTINPTAGPGQQILVGGVSGGVGTTVQVLTPGQPINSFFVYQQIGDTNGVPIYKDQNSDGIINVDDRRPYKSPDPKWILGHSSYVTYKQFDLSFTLRAYLGSYVYNNVASSLGDYTLLNQGAPYNLSTSILTTGFKGPQFLSDVYVEKAAFLRMDNISAGYTFQLGKQSARFFLAAQNAFTITGYSGVDPTAGLNGLDNNIYPRARTFTSGLSLRL